MTHHSIKYLIGATITTSALFLTSHHEASAATIENNQVDQGFNHQSNGNAITNTNQTDSSYNHDENGNPITAENNIDSSFNHDQEGNPIASDNNIDSNFNHDQNGDAIVAEDNVDASFNHDGDGNPLMTANSVDSNFNHDAVGQPIHANNQAMISRSMQQSHDSTSSQSAITTHHQSKSLPATGQERTRSPYIGFVITLVLGVAFILLRKTKNFSKCVAHQSIKMIAHTHTNLRYHSHLISPYAIPIIIYDQSYK